MRHRSPARFLAPLALIASAFAVYTLVQPEMDSGSASSTPPALTQEAKRPSGKAGRTKAHTYKVRRNDTLSGIAAKNGLSVQHILRLNPGLDANSLRVGRTLRLRT